MKKQMRTAKRALAFLLALEMLCTPLAMARVQDPEQAIRETPQGEETMGQGGAADNATADLPAEQGNPSAELAAMEEYYSAAVAYGIPLTDSGNGHPQEYNGYLGYESADRSWGYRGIGAEKVLVQQGDMFYTTLPDEAQIGRIPDKELDGFYLYGATPSGEDWYSELPQAARADWEYDESWYGHGAEAATYRFQPTDLTADEVGLEEDGDQVVVRLPVSAVAAMKGHFGKMYDDATAEAVEMQVYCVPIVARWKDSVQSHITTMALTLADKDGNATQLDRVYASDPRGETNPETVDLTRGEEEEELGSVEADSEGNRRAAYYLRVPKAQEKLTLRFQTYEPYYHYSIEGTGSCPVTATYTVYPKDGPAQEKQSLEVHSGWLNDAGDAYEDPIDPAPVDANNDGKMVPRNRYEEKVMISGRPYTRVVVDPARGQWTVPDIPLASVAQVDIDHSPFTTIDITVTAPDGQNQTTYTFYVERLDEAKAELGYGNTPFGQIDKSTSALWNDNSEDTFHNKEALKAYFRDSSNTLDLSNIEALGGIRFSGEYTTAAWRGANLDLDSNAVVTYQDMPFVDPGVSFVDSEGRFVRFGLGEDVPATHTTCVTRTLKLQIAKDKLTPDLYGETADTQPERIQNVWYVGGTAVWNPNQAAQVLQNGDGSDVVDLTGLKVLPGVYDMVYTFTDPVNGDRNEDGQMVNHVTTITRKLVVLPIPGDVDMDGAVTHADARVLEKYQETWNSATKPNNGLNANQTTVYRLLSQRVYGQVKMGTDTYGATAIRQGFQPVVGRNGHTDYFYPRLLPAGYQETKRKTWSEVGDDLITADGAKLELRYLGVENGTRGESGATTEISGPWKADPKVGVSIRNDTHPDAKDTFWVGVYLTLPEGSELYGQMVEDLTVSLTYDSDYITPAEVYLPGAAGDRYTNAEERWRDLTLYQYNMGTQANGSGAFDENGLARTLFAGKAANDYISASSAWARDYATHYSKIKGDLETAVGATENNPEGLKELVVSLQRNQGVAVTLPKESCLFVLPFRLKKHPALPDGGAPESARLLELSAGMRDLNVVTLPRSTSTFAGASAHQVLYMAELFAQETGLSPVDRTYAFSAQESIYGDATQNLRAQLSCEPTEKGLVKLGEDNTDFIVLTNEAVGENFGKNAQYAVPFEHSSKVVADNDYHGEGLPPGLEYDNRGMILTKAGAPGPIEAGEYTFTIKGYPYKIIVAKRTIHYHAVGGNTYYGETVYRGKDNEEDYSFLYEVSELAPRDNPDGAATGRGTDLGSETDADALIKLKGYVKPAFTAVLSDDENSLDYGKALTSTTSVGSYPILSRLPLSQNYEFVYDRTPENKLYIERRPVVVESIIGDYTSDNRFTRVEIYHDEYHHAKNFTLDETQSAISGPGKMELTLGLPDGIHEDGTYGQFLLTGPARVGEEKLKITFAGTYQRNEWDESQGETGIFLQSAQEIRQVSEIGALALTEDWAINKNYRLVGTLPRHPENDQVQALVNRRGITAIEITSVPNVIRQEKPLPAQAGDTLDSPKELRLKLHLDNKSAGDFVWDYDSVDLKVWNLHFNWIPAEDYEDAIKDPKHKCTLECVKKHTGWDPTAPVGQQDTCAYGGTIPITTQMDGYRLCVSAWKFAGSGEGEIVTAYCPQPLRVAQRTITLTPQPASRFYGDPNTTLTYTYDPQRLSLTDRRLVNAWAEEHGYAQAKGTQEELEALLTELHPDPLFEAPVIEAMKTNNPSTGPEDPNIIDESTDVPRAATQYYVVISGGNSTDYAFRYAQVQLDGSPAVVDSKRGYAPFTIEARPIVVDALYSDDQQSTDNFATIYADTKELFLEGQRDENGYVPFEAPTSRVEFKLADLLTPGDLSGGLTYYNAGNQNNQVRRTDVTYATDTVILEKDRADLRVGYTVRFIPDRAEDNKEDLSHGQWNSFTNNFFGVEKLEAVGGSDQRKVEVGDLKLLGTAAGNYTLVYRNGGNALAQVPACAGGEEDVWTAPDPGERRLTAYYVYGTGTVVLRPIAAMSLSSLGNMQYTYGQNWAPDQANGNQKLTLQVEYETTYDNAPDRNQHTEQLVFYADTGANDTMTDSFALRGFHIYYLDKDTADKTAGNAAAVTEAEKAAVDAGNQLEPWQHLYPGLHDGAAIFVMGKRGENDPSIYSKLGSRRLTVRKAQLTFTANDLHRFYGEENTSGVCREENAAVFSYRYDQTQLAEWDRVPEENYTGYAADLAGLAGIERVPAIRTSARSDSPINKEQWGEYPMSFSQTTFELDNYVVTGEPGTLYVYPRPLQVNDIRHSAENPVYTIYNATTAYVFFAQYDTTEDRLVLGRPFGDATTSYAQTLVNPNAPGGPAMVGVAKQLPLSSSILMGSDVLGFEVKIEEATPGKWQLTGGATDASYDDMIVTVNSLVPTDTSKNYTLTNAGWNKAQCYGAVKLRSIDHIHITQRPKMNYIYGEVLDLSGLKVRIDYAKGSGDSQAASNEVSYLNPEQFQSNGLYVNYWDMADQVPTSSDARKALTSAYRKAHSGDHVTIAPTHDTQQFIGTSSTDPLKRPFAANGKTLIISAFQATTVQGNQNAAAPVILGSSAVRVHNLTVYDYTPVESGSHTDSGTNSVGTLRVDPRQLTYTLSAEDKTYDGNTQAAGTVTLTNVFDATAQIRVDENNQTMRELVQDAIYLPIGAAYERESTNYAEFSALTAGLTNGRISFQTGSYQANEPGLLSPNKAIAWANRYTYGGDKLTFTFVNPNVHYEDEAFDKGRPAIGPDATYDWARLQTLEEVTSAHDVYNAVTALPVEVTNMRILGPDAANYTWGEPDERRVDSTEVRVSTRAAAENGQAAAPFATIHKANREKLQGRSALPTLAVDLHSNAIRLGMTQDYKALGDQNDQCDNELHFEYALFYDQNGILTFWAGDLGDWDHQDVYFFGGEVVRPYIDPAYRPDLNRLPKAETANENTIYKGQRYLWAQEDEGMTLDPSAYPGGAILTDKDGNPVKAEDAYWFYTLYNTTRQPLPRGTVFYPLVRLSETRNYNPSADLSGDERVTAESLEAAKAAVAEWSAAPEEEQEEKKTAALEASAVVLSEAEGMKKAAEKASADKVQADLAHSEKPAEKGEVTDLPLTASAVKTFPQRLELLSASRERNTEGEDRTTEFMVTMLESLWFTDTLRYEEAKLLDSVVSNRDPVRYYGYYWDADYSAALHFAKDEPVDLTGDWMVSIRSKDEGEREINVNPEENGGRSAKLYVSTSTGGGNKVRTIRIVPSALYARLGDPPYALGVVTDPPRPSNHRYRWSSSNPDVATVDQNGLVTFRGLGEAVITVETDNQRSASIRVIVSEVLPLPEIREPLFNFNFSGPWETLEEDGAFRPHEEMTRAQLVVLLDIFLNPNDRWNATAELAYVDITGKERYYDALSRLTAAGVVKGVPGQAFAGEQPVTRAEFAVMLCRMLQLEVPNTAGQIHMFEDAGQTETWAYAYIDALAKTGVMRGVGGGRFAPQRVLTREESAAVIARLLVTRLTSDQTNLKRPTDMTPANWSYEHVLRAINAIAYPD